MHRALVAAVVVFFLQISLSLAGCVVTYKRLLDSTTVKLNLEEAQVSIIQPPNTDSSRAIPSYLVTFSASRTTFVQDLKNIQGAIQGFTCNNGTVSCSGVAASNITPTSFQVNYQTCIQGNEPNDPPPSDQTDGDTSEDPSTGGSAVAKQVGSGPIGSGPSPSSAFGSALTPAPTQAPATQAPAAAAPASATKPGCFWSDSATVELTHPFNPTYVNCMPRFKVHRSDQQHIYATHGHNFETSAHGSVPVHQLDAKTHQLVHHQAGVPPISISQITVEHGPVVNLWTDGHIVLNGAKLSPTRSFNHSLLTFPPGKYDIVDFVKKNHPALLKQYRTHFGSTHGVATKSIHGEDLPPHDHSCWDKLVYFNWLKEFGV